MVTELERIYDYIDQQIDEHIARVQEYIRQPSVATTGEGIRECAELTKRYIKELGFQKADIYDPGVTKWGPGNPVVYGEYDVGAPKTLIIYWQYDTVPAYDPSQWISPPYEARIMEQPPFKKVVIGRGAWNSKGPEIALLNALHSIKAVAGELPVNLKFVGEGDEERGSIGLEKFVYEHKDWLSKADAMYGGMIGQDSSGLVHLRGGAEGCLIVQLETSGRRWGRGPVDGPIHGGYKRSVDSVAWRHIKMLSTLVSEDGNEILIDGWYDDVEHPSERDHQMLDEAMKYWNPDPETSKRLLGIKHHIGDKTGKDLLIQGLYVPSFNLDGIWATGLTDPKTISTVMPDKVISKHNCRYVPNQDGQDLVKKLRAHLDKHGYQDVEVSVIMEEPWVKANYDTEIAQAVFKMCKKFGVNWLALPGCGAAHAVRGPSWPGYLFNRDPLHLPIILGHLGHGARSHAYDEYFVIEDHGKVYGLAGAEKGYATVLYNFAGKE